MKIKITLSENLYKRGLLSAFFNFLSSLFWILFNIFDVNNLIDVEENSPFNKEIFTHSFIPVTILMIAFGLILLLYLIKQKDKTVGVGIPFALFLLAFCFACMSLGLLITLCFQKMVPATPAFLVLFIILNCVSDIYMFAFTQPLLSEYSDLKQKQRLEGDEKLPYQKNNFFIQSYKALILLLFLDFLFLAFIEFFIKEISNPRQYMFQNGQYYNDIFYTAVSYIYLFASMFLSARNYRYLVRCGLTKPSMTKKFVCIAFPIFQFVAAVVLGLKNLIIK